VVRDGEDSGVAMMAVVKMAAVENSSGGQQQRWLATSMRAAAANDGVDGSRQGEALNGGVGSNGSMMAAQRRQWRWLKGNKGGCDDTIRAVGETVANDGVGGGRRGGGRGRVDGECVFCVLPALFTYYLDKASKNLTTF
jgi:hypothetical protein